MSRVIKAAIWQDQPWLVEVPPPPPPPPEPEPDILPDAPAAGKDSTDPGDREQVKENAGKIIAEAEKKKAEAENMLAAVRQEAERIMNRAAEDYEKKMQQLEEELKEKRQEAEKNAAELLENAQKQAKLVEDETREANEKLRTEAEAAAAALKEEARQTGHKEGYEAGWQEGNEKALAEQKQAILDANAKAEKTLKDAEQEKAQYVQQAEKEIAGVVLHAVDKILPQHFIDVPQVILPLVRKALLKIKDQPRIVIHVAPAQYDLVLMARSEFQSALEGAATLEVSSDESLGLGDVVLETPNGNVDARLETQLELVKKAVQDVMI